MLVTIEFRINIHVHLSREWVQRRVIITKDVVSFAFVGEDHQIDHIPLSEVEFVKEMKGPENHAGIEMTAAQDAQDLHKIQIATLPTGYNSGRVYYLATRDQEEFTALIARLTKLAKAARKRAEAHTLFRKIQLKVRKHYEAGPVQALMALMIMAVYTLDTYIQIFQIFQYMYLYIHTH